MCEKFNLHRKRVLSALVIIAGILLAWFLIPMIYNPMRMPAPMIRTHVLRHTPIGMDMEEVIKIIENNERWGGARINIYSGFRHTTLFVEDPDGNPTSAIIGQKSVQTHPERYNVLLFERHLRIFWGFNEKGNLIEVHVRSSFTRRLA